MKFLKEMIHNIMDYYRIYTSGLFDNNLKLKDKPVDYWVSILDNVEFEEYNHENFEITRIILRKVLEAYTEITNKYPNVSIPNRFNVSDLSRCPILDSIDNGVINLRSFYKSNVFGNYCYAYVSVNWIKYLIKNIDEFENIIKDSYIEKSETEIKKLTETINNVLSN